MELIKLPHYGDLPLPVQEQDNAGVDLRAARIPMDDHPDGEINSIVLQPGDEVLVHSGLKIHIGSTYAHGHLVHNIGIYGLIVPRSGLGFKHYVRLANTAGVIDANYQGEIMIKIRNESTNKPLEIERGDRLCQMIFQPYLTNVKFDLVDEFSRDSSRGENGFGSSGVK